MSWIQNLFPSHLTNALGWTLIHSLWQGAALAILLALALIFLRKNSSRVRYFIATSALFTLVLASVITFMSLYQTTPEIAQNSTPTVEKGISKHLIITSIEVQSSEKLTFFSNYFNKHLPLIVTIWLLGVVVLMLRFLGGYALLQRLKYHQITGVDKDWQVKVLEIADQLKIKKVVRLFESAKAKTPMVLGYLKPVILLPLGTISGLTSKQVESILAHEMAHIARNDYLVNILQSIVEIFLFFNPAMWWISAQVREEREHCCDDIALQLTNDHLTLVKTLATLEEMRITSPKTAVAFAGKKGGLVGRIRRIINSPRINATFSEGFVAAILLVGFLFMASFYMRTSPNKATMEAKASAASVETKASKVETPETSTSVTPIASAKNVKDTIRFGKFMIVTKPNGNVAVFRNGKKIKPEDYDKYENEFAINNEKIRIGKKGKNPITIDIEPKKSYSNVYDYDNDVPLPPLPPSYRTQPLPPMPPMPPNYGNDMVHTWSEDRDGKKYKLKWVNGNLVELRIDGRLIASEDYHKHQDMINACKKRFRSPAFGNPPNGYKRYQKEYARRMKEWQKQQEKYMKNQSLEVQKRWKNDQKRRQSEINRQMENIKKEQSKINYQMIETGNVLNAVIGKMKNDSIIPENTKDYRLSIQNGYIKINGKKLNKQQYEEYRQLILKMTGKDIKTSGHTWNWTSTHTDDD